MGNIIRLNGNAPKEKWLSISNQGTDMFLELLRLIINLARRPVTSVMGGAPASFSAILLV